MASLAAKLCVGVLIVWSGGWCAAAMQELPWLHLDGMMCSTVLLYAVLLGFLLCCLATTLYHASCADLISIVAGVTTQHGQTECAQPKPGLWAWGWRAWWQ
jgi:hypothetical protein